jgi:heme/copper-type cytochrome/quinol oxidase subunit 1
MTVTEAPPQAPSESPSDTAPSPAAEAPAPSGLAAVLGSGDPRAVGKLFIGTSLVFFLLSGVTGLLVGLEQIDLGRPDSVLPSDAFAQTVTLHHITGLFLVVIPLLLGIAMAVVPLQVGASTVAFPRASAAAYWTYLMSGGLIVASFIANGGPFGGDADAVALFLVAMIAAVVALCVATISIVTTVLTLRTPGMSLRRTPLFAWSMLVAGAVWLLTLPMLGGLLVLFYVDFTYGPQLFGGASDIYNQIRWVFWQPTLYAFAIPALGIIGDVVPVFAQRRHYRHATAMALIAAFGALSFGAWAQLGPLSQRVSEGDPEAGGLIPWLHDAPWILVSVAVVLPLAGLLGLWAITLWQGRPRVSGPLLATLGAGLLLLVGVLAGVGTVVEDLEVAGTTWMSAQAYAVLVGTFLAAIAALAFWAPKIYGSLLPDALVRLLAPLIVLGGLALAVGYAIAGLLNQQWFVPGFIDQGAALSEVDAVEGLNLVAVIGGALVVLGGLAVGLLLLRGVFGSRPSPGDDPWRGHTLEWTTTSPPPVGNFATLPEITSEAPLYDARHARRAPEGTAPGGEISPAGESEAAR